MGGGYQRKLSRVFQKAGLRGRSEATCLHASVHACLHTCVQGLGMCTHEAFPVVKNLSANAGDAGSIPGSGRSPGEGNRNPLQYSCLENPTDRGAWRVTVRGFSKVKRDLKTKQ